MSSLEAIKDALLSVTDNVGRYKQLNKKYPYIVWAEDGQANAVWANNHMASQALNGTIDYFTKVEDDPNVEAIQRALNAASIPFRLNSVQYEEDKGIIHYEWVWSLWRE